MSQKDKFVVFGTESGKGKGVKEETWKIVNGNNNKNTVKNFVKDNRELIAFVAAMAAAQTLYNVARNRIKSR